MNGAPVPLLWLCGPSGVGKSTVGCEIFSQLERAGVPVGYVDLDQVGLCYPAPADDPGNHRVKSRGLGAVWPAHRDAGVRCLVVSGGVETADQVRAYAGQVPDAAVTLMRLRAGHRVLVERFLGRGWRPDLLDEVVRDADELERGKLPGPCVDTDGLPVPEVARLVRERAGGWPRHDAATLDPAPLDPAPLDPATLGSAPLDPMPPHEAPTGEASTGETALREGGHDGVRPGSTPVLWVCRPPAVGKSTVGYEIFTQVNGSGVKAAYVDLAQIGFCRPAPAGDPGNHRLKARNLGALWPMYRDAGARCLVVTGAVHRPETVRAYADAVPGTALTLCRLHAGPAELARRVLLRGAGGGPTIPGKALKGWPEDALLRFAERAAREAAELERVGLGDLCVDTDGRTVEEVAGLVRARAGGWPA
ncbi:hypothetical protein GCM10023322_45150 [Rugosimonospora acidiphila]|uniref:Adenylyl-sulfate kinase n=1 Tax=Rugosimonospora acidiphila TaxID=556531 RepID=A0ABP9S3A4_9ACTN